MRRHQILSLADARFRLVTLADVRTAGGSPSTWRRALLDGLIVEVHPGVALVAGAERTPLTRVAAAVRAAGPDALVSHRAAAHLWGAPIPLGDDVDVIRRRDSTSTLAVPGIVVHRPRDRRDLVAEVRQGIPVTSPLRTLCDLGAVAPESVDPALRAMRISGVITLDAAKAALLRHARKGRAGITPLRTAIEAQALESKPPDSVLEEAMARLIRRFGLPPVEFHACLAGFEVDFWVTGTVLYLECDGWSSHGLDHDQFEFDRRRDAALVAAGHVPIRFTWSQITRQPGEVAARIRDAVRQWAPHLLDGPTRR